MKISLICPTRGRPFSMFRFWTTAQNMCEKPDLLEVVFRIDDDDYDSIQFCTDMQSDFGDKIKMVMGDRNVTMSHMNNEAADISTGEILMYAGDDLSFVTKSWDEQVRKTFDEYSDKICLVYGKDGINNEKLATHGFLHRKTIDIVGYFMPPFFPAFFADTYWTEVYHNLKRRRFIDIETPHLHYTTGQSPYDKTTKEMHERHNNLNGSAIWYNTLQNRIDDTRKLLKYINGEELDNYERML